MATDTGKEVAAGMTTADLVAEEGGGEIKTTYTFEPSDGASTAGSKLKLAEPSFDEIIVNRVYEEDDDWEINSIDLGGDLANTASAGDRKTMRIVAFEVNRNMSVANAALYETARELYLAKEQMDHGCWGPFLESGILSVSKRAATELVSAWPTLKQYPELQEMPIMSSLTTRTLSFIFSDKVKAMGGKSADELRKAYLIEAKNNSDLTTEAGAKGYFSGKKAGKKEADKSAKDAALNEQIKALRTQGAATYEANEDIRQIKAKELRAERKIEKLKEEITQIEESIKQMQSSKVSAGAAKAYLTK